MENFIKKNKCNIEIIFIEKNSFFKIFFLSILRGKENCRLKLDSYKYCYKISTSTSVKNLTLFYKVFSSDN